MANSLQTTGNSLHLMGFTGGFAYSALIPVTSTIKASHGLSELTIAGGFSEEGIVAPAQKFSHRRCKVYHVVNKLWVDIRTVPPIQYCNL